ncbi:MAG: hypothetical protein ACTSQE_01320 [Candidatus Heimdallarchaeaceae archaeon]
MENAHFWGYSMGGRIGFASKKYYPNRFHSFILGGTRDANKEIISKYLNFFKGGVQAFIVSIEEKR